MNATLKQPWDLKSRDVILRPATMADSAQLLEWRNDPETRRQSFSMDPVTPEQHERFLLSKLPYIRMARMGPPWQRHEILVGQVRVCEGVVSYSVDAKWRGMGYGTKIIEALMPDRTLGAPIIADVKPGNAASLKVFRRLEWYECPVDGFIRFSYAPQPR